MPPPPGTGRLWQVDQVKPRAASPRAPARRSSSSAAQPPHAAACRVLPAGLPPHLAPNRCASVHRRGAEGPAARRCLPALPGGGAQARDRRAICHRARARQHLRDGLEHGRADQRLRLCEYPQVFGGAAALSTHWIGGYERNDEIPSAAIAYLRNRLPPPAEVKLYMDRGTTQLDAQYDQAQPRIDALMAEKGFSRRASSPGCSRAPATTRWTGRSGCTFHRSSCSGDEAWIAAGCWRARRWPWPARRSRCPPALRRTPASVDPFIGTQGTGHTFGRHAALRHGGPQPRHRRPRLGSFGRLASMRRRGILGFSNTHISGAGIPELGVVLLQPAAGQRWTRKPRLRRDQVAPQRARASRFLHGAPAAQHGVTVALTATPGVALHRYTFDRAGWAGVARPAARPALSSRGLRVTQAEAQVDAAAGEVSGTVHLRNWVERQASFALRFSRPIAQVIRLPERPGERRRAGCPASTWAARCSEAGGVVHRRRAGARANLATADALSFDHARRAADAMEPAARSRVDRGRCAHPAPVLLGAVSHAAAPQRHRRRRWSRCAARAARCLPRRMGVTTARRACGTPSARAQPLATLLWPERVPGLVRTLLAHHRQQATCRWGRPGAARPTP